MRWTAVVTAAAAGIALSASPASGAPGDVVSLEFDDLVPASLPVTATPSTGTATLTTSVVSREGGEVLAVQGRHGAALRLPAYSPSAAQPRAVLRLTDATAPVTGVDTLSPGSADFAFGATAKLDADSQGTDTDNGNNLLQRGLGGDVAQYKLDLDRRYPHCVVKGDLGRVSVRIREAVSPDDWYSLLCRRSGSTVTLTVDHHHADGTTTRSVAAETGLIGDVTMSSPAVSLTVGGKINGNDVIVASSDQFNGLVDDVLLRIPG